MSFLIRKAEKSDKAAFQQIMEKTGTAMYKAAKGRS